MKKFINPFKFISLRTAWCWGIATLILCSIYCWQIGLRLTSLSQTNYLGDRLWAATLRQVIVWVLLSVILYLLGIVASKSKVRFVDVAAFNLFARLPFDLSMLIFAFPSVRSVMALMVEGSFETAMQYTNVISAISVVTAVMSIWYYVWTYNAFSVATNLKGFKGIALFIVGWLAAYILSAYALMF